MSVRYVGKDIPRNDGFDKVTGRGRGMIWFPFYSKSDDCPENRSDGHRFCRF